MKGAFKWAKKEEIEKIVFFEEERAHAEMGDMCSNTWIKLERHNLYIAGNLKRQIKYLVENEMIFP